MTQSPSEGLQDQERTHSEEPTEGAPTDQVDAADTPRAHAEAPAEGADDASATS